MPSLGYWRKAGYHANCRSRTHLLLGIRPKSLSQSRTHETYCWNGSNGLLVIDPKSHSRLSCRLKNLPSLLQVTVFRLWAQSHQSTSCMYGKTRTHRLLDIGSNSCCWLLCLRCGKTHNLLLSGSESLSWPFFILQD